MAARSPVQAVALRWYKSAGLRETAVKILSMRPSGHGVAETLVWDNVIPTFPYPLPTQRLYYTADGGR